MEKYNIRSGRDNQINDLKQWFPNESNVIDKYWEEIEKGASTFEGYVKNQISNSSIIEKYVIEPYLTKSFSLYAEKTITQALDEIGIKDPILRAVICYGYGNYGLPPNRASW